MEGYSESAERNKQPILEKLQKHLSDQSEVLEIGSGSGQHAIFFAEHFPGLAWQASETAGQLDALRHNIRQHPAPNLPPPLLLDVQSHRWPLPSVDNIFTANTLHIMPWDAVTSLFSGIGRILRQQGQFIIYGAMRYHGRFTSASNARFDSWLKQQDPRRGIRDFEAIDRLASEQGLALVADYTLPSNNQLLVWVRERS